MQAYPAESEATLTSKPNLVLYLAEYRIGWFVIEYT